MRSRAHASPENACASSRSVWIELRLIVVIGSGSPPSRFVGIPIGARGLAIGGGSLRDDLDTSRRREALRCHPAASGLSSATARPHWSGDFAACRGASDRCGAGVCSRTLAARRHQGDPRMAKDLKLGLQLGYWQRAARPPTSSSSPRRRSASATTRCGPPRPGARTPSRRWPGSAPTPTRIRLGTAIVQISRAHARPRRPCTPSPSTTSRAGGMILGLGVSGPQVVEGWYGQPFAKPLARTREYVDIIRQVLRARGAGDERRPALPAALHGPGRLGTGQAAAVDHPPAARRPADLPRRRGPEERRHGRGDRRRLAAALLLALPPGGLRRVAGERRSPASRSRSS